MKITALMDQVVIEPLIETVSKGGILLPTAGGRNDLPCERGTVVSVGPGKWDTGKFVETTLKQGQMVAYHNYPSGVELKENGKKYIVIQERQIVALLKP